MLRDVPGAAVNHSETRYWLRAQGVSAEDVAAELEDHEDVEWVAPVYKRGGIEGPQSRLAVIPDVLLIRYDDDVERRSEASEDIESHLADAFDLEEDDAEGELLGPFHYYELPPESVNGTASYTLFEDVEAERDISEVRLESMPMISPLTAAVPDMGVQEMESEPAGEPLEEEPITHVPNDPEFRKQWNLTRIGMPTTWNLSTGTNQVKVGVLDTGTDRSHEDLGLHGSGFNAGTQQNDGSPVQNNAHGTACAGIAAAILDNNRGIAGVAGGSSVVPVSIPNWTEVEVARAINWAANVARVDVISMSFGWWTWDEAIINPAIDNAHDNRNVVLIAATGNENNNVIRYPARHPKTIAVGASDQNDERKRPESPDGERWGSSWGPTIDVVAPGVRIWATDITGNRGYTNGNYTERFNGTSSATPHVAGLAALMRTFKPSLRNTEIRNLIEQNCDKVRTNRYSYTRNVRKPNGSWNQEMGYGRINPYRTLVAASYTQRRYTGTHFGGTLGPNQERRQWVGPWPHMYVVDYDIRPTTDGGMITSSVASRYKTASGIYYLLSMKNDRATQTNFEARFTLDW